MVMIRYAIGICFFVNLSALSMDLEITSAKQKKVKIPKKYRTLLDVLPLEIQGLIGNFLWQLNNVDFNTIDCYEKRILTEKNPINDTTRYYEDEKPLIEKRPNYGVRPGVILSYQQWHTYAKKNIILCSHVFEDALIINHHSHQRCITQRWVFNDLMPQCFSPHHNLFATTTSTGRQIKIRNVNNGEEVKIIKSRCERIQFGLDEPVIKIYTPAWCYKLYFDNPTKRLLTFTSFTWREAYLICTIYGSNSEYKPSIISKKSIDYIVYRGLPKKIRYFLKKYLNTKIKFF